MASAAFARSFATRACSSALVSASRASRVSRFCSSSRNDARASAARDAGSTSPAVAGSGNSAPAGAGAGGAGSAGAEGGSDADPDPGAGAGVAPAPEGGAADPDASGGGASGGGAVEPEESASPGGIDALPDDALPDAIAASLAIVCNFSSFFFFRTTLPLGIAARAATEARGAQCHLDRDRDGESGDETPRGSVHERRDRISATNRHIFRTFVCVVF